MFFSFGIHSLFFSSSLSLFLFSRDDASSESERRLCARTTFRREKERNDDNLPRAEASGECSRCISSLRERDEDRVQTDERWNLPSFFEKTVETGTSSSEAIDKFQQGRVFYVTPRNVAGILRQIFY